MINLYSRIQKTAETTDFVVLMTKDGANNFRTRKYHTRENENKVSVSHLKDLQKKTEKVRWKNTVRKEEFALFSRSGFTKELKDLASERDDLTLFDLKDLERVFK